MKKKSYRSYVSDARQIISKVESYQFKIASMALKACDKNHTVSDFARDIGIANRTLLNWVQIYKNVIEKVGIANPTPRDWSAAAKVNDYLKTERKEGGEKAFKGNLPKRKVVQLFKKVNDPENNQFLAINRALSSAKHIRHTVKTIDLTKTSRESLKELMYSLNEASVYLNDFLLSERSAS